MDPGNYGKMSIFGRYCPNISLLSLLQIYKNMVK